ncbi:ribosome recycling factor family protein [Shewanella sp. NIFS-20-20]|uniref:ribosome recycling factor family protein n=1 Tax=Shewanella sp. NIFS-20-20 TaxID=2853806 RepID=UPI001C46E15A|nr:ribosome recycling factor family protein [Shewanella sp. NIFS-20-20]MBV7316580.1 ribosome recycling factor family protein [Shewanella sp. NIFS-20-20]
MHHNEPINIHLPALIHRIGRTLVSEAQTLAKQYGCQLKRVRRSRHWSANGLAMDIQSLAQALKDTNQDAFIYLTNKLEAGLVPPADKLEPLPVKLARLNKDNPNITLRELIALTACTQAEARLARFETEIL